MVRKCLIPTVISHSGLAVGALTKNIVAMKERLEGDLAKESSESSFLPAISEAQKKKEREMVSKEVIHR